MLLGKMTYKYNHFFMFSHQLAIKLRINRGSQGGVLYSSI